MQSIVLLNQIEATFTRKRDLLYMGKHSTSSCSNVSTMAVLNGSPWQFSSKYYWTKFIPLIFVQSKHVGIFKSVVLDIFLTT